jgi:hypothetical protein
MQRQSGKTQFLMLRACEELLLVPNSYTLFVTASRDQAEAIFHRKLRLPLQRLLGAAGLPANTLKVTQHGAENPAINSALEIVASSEATVPSRSVSLLVLDEGKYIADPVLVASTAGDPSGWFHAACTRADSDITVIRVDGNENPYADPGVIGFVARLLERVLPLARRRDIDNLFAEDGDQAIPGALWDGCVESSWGPSWPTRDVPLYQGADLALTGDSAAVVDVFRDGDQVILAGHKIWRPTKAAPLNFSEVEDYIRQRARQFHLVECRVDPYQAARSVALLRAERIPMVEYPQTVGTITTMVTTLLDCLQSGALVLYPSDELREQATNAIILNAGRGFKFAKERGSRKIDALIALSMAVTAAVEAPSYAPAFVI